MQEQKDNKNLIEQGFTLIELLVVIAILGILAAVVVFSVGGIVDRGNSSACKSEVATVNTAIQAFQAQSATQAYPAGPAVSDLSAQLVTAKLLAAGSDLTKGATAKYSAAYAPATGAFTASCP